MCEQTASHLWTFGGSLLCETCVLSHFSHVWLCATQWTVALQAPLSMGFSRQEYWSGLPCPPPGDLPDSGIKPTCLTSLALAGRFFTTSTTWETFLTQGSNSGLPHCRQTLYPLSHQGSPYVKQTNPKRKEKAGEFWWNNEWHKRKHHKRQEL